MTKQAALCVAAVAFVVAVALAKGATSAVQHQQHDDAFARWFGLVDADGSGQVTRAELGRFFALVHGPSASVASIDKVFELAGADPVGNSNGDRGVTLDHLTAALPRLAQEPATDTTPEQIHISIVDNTTMAVMWVTRANTTTSTVEFSAGPNSTKAVASGGTHTYTAGGWQGVIHEVHIPNLAPSVTVTYRVGDASGGWSESMQFVTPPSGGDAEPPLVVATYGDMGTAIPAGYLVCEQMHRDSQHTPFDAYLHYGDIAYGSVKYTDESGSGLGKEAEVIWDIFMRQIQPLASTRPYIAGVGNHEKFYNFSSYLARFRMPKPWGTPAPMAGTLKPLHDEPTPSNMYFSVNVGRVHFVQMDTEHNYQPGSPQYQWLEADLRAANANRAAVPWVVLTGHRPMYCSDHAELNSHVAGAMLQKAIEPLMLNHSVDLWLSGHMHMYERVHAVRNGTVVQASSHYYNPGAPVQVVQGTAGVFEDLNFVDPAPAWSAFRHGSIGYGRMTVHNRTHLFYEYRPLHGAETLDTFWLEVTTH